MRFEPLEDRRLLTVAYSLTDLGTFAGGTLSIANAINNNSQVVGGASTVGGNEHAFLYNNGTMYDLGVLPGGKSSTADGINDSGVVVGNSDTASGLEHAFVYSNGVMQDLGTLIGARESYANGINNSGQVVGEASFSSQQFPAIVFSNGAAKSLGTLAGPWSSATAIADNGEIAGGTDTDHNINAFIYTNGVMQDIGTLPHGTFSNATAINNKGQVVGFADIGTGTFYGFLYSGGTMSSLGTLPGGLSSYAQGINDAGQIVGYATLANGAQHAFLDAGGTMTDLNSLIDPSLGWDLEGAAAINKAGQIVGYGAGPSGSLHAYLLTPVTTAISPQVTGVYVDSTGWASNFLSGMQATGQGTGAGYSIPGGGASQLSDVPWINLNQIQIEFNKNVNVQENSLTVTGINVAQYTFSNFSYDSSTFTATWTLSKPIGADRIKLDLQSTGAHAVSDTSGNALDGEWTNGASTFPSGNGVAGGDFNFSFNVLPGDIAHVGIVNGQDIAPISSSWLKTGFQIGDLNGDGVVNGQDLAVVSASWFATLPAAGVTAATQQIASQSVGGNADVIDNGTLSLADTVGNDTAVAADLQAASLVAVQGAASASSSTVAAEAQNAVALTAGGWNTPDSRKGAALAPIATSAAADAGLPGFNDQGRAKRAALVDGVMNQHVDFGALASDPAVDSSTFGTASVASAGVARKPAIRLA